VPVDSLDVPAVAFESLFLFALGEVPDVDHPIIGAGSEFFGSWRERKVSDRLRVAFELLDVRHRRLPVLKRA